MEIVPKNLLSRKEILGTLFMPAVVVLVGVGAFGLGRLSRIEEAKQPLIIRNGSQVAAPLILEGREEKALSSVMTEGKYVASKSGSKYYLSTCSGAKNIKEENRIFFSSVSAAEAAGYEPAANCPGL